MRTLLLALAPALALNLIVPPLEALAVSCHCFRDRSFDPGRPGAADPYVLATAQNSVMAAAFGLEKRVIVQAKMTGSANEDLWLAHFLASRTGLTASELLDARARSGSWAEALGGLGVEPERVGGHLAGVLRRASTDATLASAVVDAVAAEKLGAAAEAVEDLRSRGATDAETVASVLLFRLTERAPSELLAQVRSGAATWGALFHAAGVEPPNIDDAVGRLLR